MEYLFWKPKEKTTTDKVTLSVPKNPLTATGVRLMALGSFKPYRKSVFDKAMFVGSK